MVLFTDEIFKNSLWQKNWPSIYFKTHDRAFKIIDQAFEVLREKLKLGQVFEKLGQVSDNLSYVLHVFML